MTKVVTYRLAHNLNRKVSVCAACAKKRDLLVGALADVQHGAHEGACDECEARAARAERALPPTAPYERGVGLRVEQLKDALTRGDARGVADAVKALRFVHGLSTDALLAHARVVRPKMERAEFDELVSLGALPGGSR